MSDLFLIGQAGLRKHACPFRLPVKDTALIGTLCQLAMHLGFSLFAALSIRILLFC